MPEAKPVVIRGVEYRTMAEAAKALGVRRQTVYSARKRGALDLVGTQEPYQVSVRGVVYPTVADAAKAHGVTRDWMYKLVARGETDLVGMKPRRKPGQGGRPKIKVSIGPFVFASATHAAKQLGCCTQTVLNTIRSPDGSLAKQRLLARAMKLCAEKEGFNDARQSSRCSVEKVCKSPGQGQGQKAHQGQCRPDRRTETRGLRG